MSKPTALDAANAERVTKALQQLHDIVEPAAPAFWPPAPGWYFIGIALLLLIALSLVWLWRRWQTNAYRRQALGELAALRANAHSIKTPQAQITALATLLRRVALHGAVREEVACLTGDAWVAYLGRHSIPPPSPDVAKLLCMGPYANLAIGNQAVDKYGAELEAAVAYVDYWIREHRPAARTAS